MDGESAAILQSTGLSLPARQAVPGAAAPMAQPSTAPPDPARSICNKMLVLSVALMRAQQANTCLMLCVGADESHAPDAGVTRVDPHDVVQVFHPRRDTCLICRLSRSTESLSPSPRATVREGEREGERERGREGEGERYCELARAHPTITDAI